MTAKIPNSFIPLRENLQRKLVDEAKNISHTVRDFAPDEAREEACLRKQDTQSVSSGSFIRELQYSLPWTYPAEIRKLIPKGSKVLDVGCGDGHNMAWVNAYGDYKVIGVDINSKDIAIAKKRKCYLSPYVSVYRQVFAADLTKKLPFNKKFDVVVCSQIVEHLEKRYALVLINKLEKLASKRVIVATINGFFQFNHRNPGKYDIHRSGWSEKEFQKLGYKVFGSGLRVVYKPGMLKDSLPRIFSPVLFSMSYLLTPLIRVFRKSALLLIAYKDIKNV